jgi:hypothetical protein
MDTKWSAPAEKSFCRKSAKYNLVELHNDLFSQRKNRTCWQCTNRDGKEEARKVKEQASKAKLAASDFKEALSIVTEDA